MVKSLKLSSKIRTKARMSILATSIHHRTRSQSNWVRKITKRHTNWQGRSKIVSADGMILYIENPKDSTKKMLELINLVNLQDKNQHTNISYGPLHYQRTIRKGN